MLTDDIRKPKCVAVICEYNPLHNGHAYHISRIREEIGDQGCIIGIMSGNFTQRGEPAIIPKYERALAAVKSGMDIVVELPFPFSSAYAETFADGGVYIAERLRASTLSFGSECGDLATLEYLADISLSDKFISAYESNREFRGSASFYETLTAVAGISHSIKPNDILGIQYIRSIRRHRYRIKPSVILRNGAGYNEASLNDCSRDNEKNEKFTSARAIRDFLKNGRDSFEKLEEYMPDIMCEFLKNSIRNGEFIIGYKNIENVIMTHFRLMPGLAFTEIADVPSGFSKRLHDAALHSSCFDEMCRTLCNRSFTMSRLLRIILYCMTGVKKTDMDTGIISYVNLLATNDNGRKYMADLRRQNGFILTKPSDCRFLFPGSERQTALAESADALYTAMMPKCRDAGYFMRKKPYIV